MILVTRMYVLIQKLNEKKSYQGLLQCCHRYLKRLSSQTGKKCKEWKHSQHHMALCASQILNKAHLFKRQGQSGLGAWDMAQWSASQASMKTRIQTLSVEVGINHRSLLPISLAKHMSPKVRGPVSKTRWGEMREDPWHQLLVSCICTKPLHAHIHIFTHTYITSSARQIF